MEQLAGKVAVVTGAAGGIGRALALALARAGCELAVSDVDEARLAETRTAIAGLGTRVTSARLDVADRAAVHAHADRVVAEHGRVCTARRRSYRTSCARARATS